MEDEEGKIELAQGVDPLDFGSSIKAVNEKLSKRKKKK